METITGPKATGETCNIVIDTRGEIPYWEGQSYGVVPPVSCQCPAAVPRRPVWMQLPDAGRHAARVITRRAVAWLHWLEACSHPSVHTFVSL